MYTDGFYAIYYILNDSIVALDVCLRLSSCWKMNVLLSLEFSTDFL